MKILSRSCMLVLLLMAFPVGAVELDARVDWSRHTELAVPVSGVVANVAANAGDHVAKGQLLLTLDAVPFATAVSEAEALVTRRRVERDETARDARQAQELYDRTVLSTVELETAKNKMTVAEAGYKSAVAALERARYRQRVSSLRAPFEARVLSRRVEVGQSLIAEMAPPVVMVIAAAGEYLAQGRLGAERAAVLKPGLALQVAVGSKNYPAQIRGITYDPVSGKEPYVLEAVFATSDNLYAGQAARVILP